MVLIIKNLKGDEMKVVETNDLGLAAYMKMNGCKIIKVKDKKDIKVFVFESEEEETELGWRIKYLNSCCHRHDTELMMLRKLMKK